MSCPARPPRIAGPLLDPPPPGKRFLVPRDANDAHAGREELIGWQRDPDGLPRHDDDVMPCRGEGVGLAEHSTVARGVVGDIHRDPQTAGSAVAHRWRPRMVYAGPPRVAAWTPTPT